MARAMWKGAIQFGLVTIPVKLYLATESKGISFNMLHKTDLSRIQMKVWCPVEDEPISRVGHRQGLRVRARRVRRHHRRGPRERPAQDRPLDRDRAVHEGRARRRGRPLRQERLLPRARQDRPQGVLPAQVGPRGRGADGDLQGRDQGPRGARRARPVRRHDAPDDAPLARRDPLDRRARPAGDEEYDFKPAELAMAKQLVSAMTGEFDPAQYKDEYREALETIIEAKVEGKETVEVEEPEESGKLIDLMAALEASVNAAKAAREAERRRSRCPCADAEGRQGGQGAPRPTAAGQGQGRGRRRRGRGARQARPEAQDRLSPAGGLGTGRELGAATARGSAHSPRCPSRNTAASATSRRRRSRRRPRRRAAARSRAVRRPAPSRDAAPLRLPARDRRRPRQLGRPEGPDPRLRRSAGWPSTSRTTRSSTSTSRASSRPSSTAPATSSSGTGAPGSPRRRPSTPRSAIADGELKFQPPRPEAQRPVHDRPDQRPPAQGRRPGARAFEDDRASSGCSSTSATTDVAGRLGRRGPPAERQDRPDQRRRQGRPRRPLDRPGAGRRRPRSTWPARSRRRCRQHIEPMLATLASKPFSDPDWLFEIKWDGFRVQAVVDDGKVRTWTRNLKDAETYFPRLLSPAVAGSTPSRRSSMARSSRSTRTGRPDFSLLQTKLGQTGRRRASSTRLRPALPRRPVAARRPARGSQAAAPERAQGAPARPLRGPRRGRGQAFYEAARGQGARGHRRQAPPRRGTSRAGAPTPG